MRRLVEGFLASALVLVLASVAGTAATAATVASAAPGGGPAPVAWASAEQQALTAVAGFLGDGGLGPPQPVGPLVASTIETAKGAVPVEQGTVVADDAAGTVVMDVALLGGTQVIVSEMRPAGGFAGHTLVLDPGSQRTFHAYALGGNPSAAAAVHRHDAVVARSAVLYGPARPQARLVTYEGCYANPQAPIVYGTAYGFLMQGQGVVACQGTRTIALDTALYRDFTSVSEAQGSHYGTYYSLDTFYTCYSIVGHNPFVTTQLWSINGALQPGTQSAWRTLSCA